MAIWSRMGLSGPAAAAGAAAIIVIVGGAYFVVQRGDVSAPPLEETAAEETAGAVAPSQIEAATETVVEQEREALAEPVAEEIAEPVTEPIEEAVGEEVAEVEAAPEETSDPTAETAAEQDSQEPALPPAPKAPAFDVVQVDPQGGGVIAGSAEPGQEVVFLLDGDEIASGRADASGKFGVLLDFPEADTPRALSIVAKQADGSEVQSTGTVLISPVQIAKTEPDPTPEPQDTPVSVENAEAVADTDETATPDPAALAQSTQPAPETSDTPAAPAVVLADNTGVTVLQPAPQPAVPNAQADAPVVANVVIDTITYDDQGEVALAGRGASQGFVRVYLNDQPIKTTRISQDGAWEAPLPDVDAGVYRLRVDEVDEEGAVTSRVETPFQREEPEVASAAPAAATAVTVQPGFTLWAIARDRFGAGEQYVRVYEANRDLIRDPDLIYPGQVFALPEG